ncbi:uncharacterized protein LOC129608426 [Condylostylus longicornis]|uniref:uncharacterized protein LOC129608426 n=1 Tax=Condylostylus longicornis TaxID=2530218 RepID=UPI00244E1674|nr:uncharacterized protein LOC129608426 [Condylostylus longicornis]
MGTVICHPLEPGGSCSRVTPDGAIGLITDVTAECHHCVTNCLPSIIVGGHHPHGERFYTRTSSSGITCSESAYILAIGQPKISVTEGLLDSQKGAKEEVFILNTGNRHLR